MNNEKLKKLPISAIIVGYNESHLLEKCLSSILFCETILYVDLGSEDNSVQLVKQIGDIEIKIEDRVPICEIIIEKYHNYVKNDWILLIDPDEQISLDLQKDISSLFENVIPDNIGNISMPWSFYYKDHLLKGTPWGGINKKVNLFNREKSIFLPFAHRGQHLKESYITYDIPYTGKNIIHHFWMLSYGQLVEKHQRYIKTDPQGRYKTGIRTTLKTVFLLPFKSFKYAYYDRRGVKDGFTGLFLSLFWSWYQTSVEIGLYNYQRKNKNKILNNEVFDSNDKL